MNKFLRSLAALTLLPGFALAEAKLQPVPEPYQYCTVCHGTQLMGNPSTGAPRLSGLPPWYVINQLTAFQKGWRGKHPDDYSGNEMRSAAEGLGDKPLAAVAEYVASTVSALSPVSVKGDVASGEKLFASCQACHGEKAQGNEALSAPNLTGQSDWYLVKQLANFKSGKRGYDAQDTLGNQMKASAAVLKDDQAIADVVAYIQSINTSQDTAGVDMKKTTTAGLAIAALAASSAFAEPKRYPLPDNSTFPIARAVEVPAGTTLVYHSGQVPGPADPSAAEGSRKYFGDTYTQTMSIFKKFESSLKDMGLGFGDAVKLTVFLVGDPEMGGKQDFSGFMKAYTQYFGTKEQPNLPARSAIQIAGLAGGPGMLVEIEMVLARPGK